MPSRKELPGNINRSKFCGALIRLGFHISTKGGRGSHFKATWTNQKSITIPERLDRDVLYYVIKEIEKVTSITWEDVKEKI